MEKNELRNKLFNKYFEIDDGILVTEFLSRLSYIPETWRIINNLCQDNIESFHSCDSISGIKIINYKNKKYMIIKLGMWHYIVIDILRNKCLNEKEIISIFNEEFFVKYFNEKLNKSYPNDYNFDAYKNNLKEIIKYYILNKSILSLPTMINYNIKTNDALTYFIINLISGKVRLGFQTEDHRLYDQLLFKYDLSPYPIQEDKNKIDEKDMLDIFVRARSIKLPEKVIPKALTLEYKNQAQGNNKKIILS